MKQLILLVALLLGMFLAWHTVFVYPLKLLVVFFHEASHALMTIATGGEVLEMAIDPQQGGYVMSSGGDRFWTLTAGYLGSLIWGSGIYLLAVISRFDKFVMWCLGAVVISIAALFIRDAFALIFALSTGAVMLGLGTLASTAVNDIVLRFVGLTSMMYAPLDIYSDTIERSSLRSDAFMLAEHAGGSTLLWGGLWIAISAVLIIGVIWIGLQHGEVPLSAEEEE